jgi:Uma2 family endonuclease
MAGLAKRRNTYEDLLQVDDTLVAELIDGDLYTSPRPATPQTRASSVLGARIAAMFDEGGSGGPGGWWILDGPELHLGPDVLVPDIGGWRRERMPVLHDIAAIELPPDWVCEVVSPRTGRIDRLLKLPVYAESGVAYAWLVDPIQRLIEAYRLVHDHWTLLGTYGDDTARIEPFDAIEIPLATLWLPEAPQA